MAPLATSDLRAARRAAAGSVHCARFGPRKDGIFGLDKENE
jgi:hypothetical protein